MSGSENLDWEVALKKNSSKKIRFNHGLPLREKSEGTYGLGAVIVAVLFVGVALFIEKRSDLSEALAIKSPKIVGESFLPDPGVKKLVENVLSRENAFKAALETDKGLLVMMSADGLFYKGKAGSANTPLNIIKEGGRDTLKLLGAKLVRYNNKLSYHVVAHTDQVEVAGQNKGGYETNWELGAAQASKVAMALNRGGILGKRITVMSKGDTTPLLPAQNIRGDFIQKNLEENRRIEIYIRK